MDSKPLLGFGNLNIFTLPVRSWKRRMAYSFNYVDPKSVYKLFSGAMNKEVVSRKHAHLATDHTFTIQAK
jgi:hypothetical protein